MGYNRSGFLNNENFWYPLDNAAKIYPAVTSWKNTNVFRITVILKDRVKIKYLFDTVYSINHRFPYFSVKLKKGFFWYYLESSDLHPSIEVDHKIFCRTFPNENCMFRILVNKNRISVEFSHILTDGSGAMEYLKTLLVEYFKRLKIEIPESFNYLRINEHPNDEEFEDAHNRYFKDDIPASKKRPNAFHLPFTNKKYLKMDVLNAVLSINEVKAKANACGVSINVYLTAVYMFVIQEIYEDKTTKNRFRRNKKLSIEVPINLRSIYPTSTMRNFSLFVMPEIDFSLGHYSFDEILKTVYHQMQLETDEKLLNKILARNVGSERKLLIRSIPLFVKSFVLKTAYYSLGSSQYSGVITNLGKISFPLEIASQIEYFSVVPPPPDKQIKVSCGVIGFDDKLVLTFTNISRSRELERRFVQFLVNQNLNIKLTS